jgi:acyl-coenzyme A thioesterase PaaI-like protein
MAAVADLGAALRELVTTSVVTTVDAAELSAAAAQARALTARLGAATRPVHQLPELDDVAAFRRVYSPVTGVGSAIAPPLQFRRVDGGVVAEVSLGPAYEGPPGLLHGGMSGLLMDEFLGAAANAAGLFGLTAHLELDYRRPVPLETPLVMRAQITDTGGRRTVAAGTIALAAAPDRPLVEARAVFVVPRPELRDAYFGAIVDSSGRNRADRFRDTAGDPG